MGQNMPKNAYFFGKKLLSAAASGTSIGHWQLGASTPNPVLCHLHLQI